MQRYQFSSPSVPEKNDFSNHVDASTSLINDNSGAISGKSNVTNGQGNGYNGGIFNGALSSDRARLFKKANSCGRPVREWYVWTEDCLVKKYTTSLQLCPKQKKNYQIKTLYGEKLCHFLVSSFVSQKVILLSNKFKISM